MFAVWKIGNNDIYDAIKIRREVFIEEQGISDEEEFDDTDNSCMHVMIYNDDGLCVATGRMYSEKKGSIHIGRVAVSKYFRGYGFGKILMKEMINKAFEELEAFEIIISAQCRAVGFYEGLGYVKRGLVYLDANIPHIEMSLLKSQYKNFDN